MKYHKIRNVNLNVCTCEQKIAYDLAFRAHISFQDKFNDAIKISNICAFNLVMEIRDFELRNYRNAYGYNPGKYDEDAIFSALNAGLMNYLKNPFIAWEYEQIGKAFPANYLNTTQKN